MSGSTFLLRPSSSNHQNAEKISLFCFSLLSLSLYIRFLFLLSFIFCFPSFFPILFSFSLSSTEFPLSWFVPILFPFSHFLIFFLPFIFSFIFYFLSLFFSFLLSFYLILIHPPKLSTSDFPLCHLSLSYFFLIS